MEKERNFLLSITLSIIFILLGIVGAFFMQSSMKKQISTQIPKSGDVNPSVPKFSVNMDGIQDENLRVSKEAAEYLISYFYNSINSGDYVTAYSLLGSDCQKKVNYDSFKKRYGDTASVKIDNIISADLEGGCFEVIAVIDPMNGDGKESKAGKYKTIYTVAMENNKLKIINENHKQL